MGKGKHRRNTAKTGDKALYRKQQPSPSRPVDDDDDAMYTKVDKFYNQRDEEDFIGLATETTTRGGKRNGSDDKDDDDDEIYQQEAVLDLGGGDVSSSEVDDDDEEEANDEVSASSEDDLEANAMSSSDDDDKDMDDVRHWGTKKSVYYHGDTADLEIGQEQEDAFVEEEAAREIEMSRMKDLSEQDFVLSDDEDADDDGINEKKKKQAPSLSSRSMKMSRNDDGGNSRDTSTWRVNEQRKFLQQHHPEFLPLVTHFTDVVQDFDQRTNVVVKALYEQKQKQQDGKEHKNATQTTAQEIGATSSGERYILSRALLQSSAALNLTMYLLLKFDYAQQQQQIDSNKKDHIPAAIMDGTDSIMSSHPVLDHLQKLHKLAETMEDIVNHQPPTGGSDKKRRKPGSLLNDQITHLVKASALLESGDMENDDDSGNKSDSDSNDDRSDSDASESDGNIARESKVQQGNTAAVPMQESSDDDDDQEDTREHDETALMNEARFALRLNDIDDSKQNKQQPHQKTRRHRRAAPDFGDEEDMATASRQNNPGGGVASRALASTVNTLEQRLATSSQKHQKKHTLSGTADELDMTKEKDEENEIRRGLELMEAELGKLESDDEGDGGGEQDESNDDSDEDDDDLKFYRTVAKKSRQSKQARKEKYAVAPKYPRLDPEVEGERAISQTILKNRGLVPHKNKLNRNPRVKKREQYRKALIRRKGAVRALRDPREGQMYGGEETGIKSGLKRSRNLS